MHNQLPIPGATVLSESMFGGDFQLMSRPLATSPRSMPPPARSRRLSCPAGPGPPSDHPSVSGPDFATSCHYASFGRPVIPAMSPSWDSSTFSSSYTTALDEASGTTASSLGSATSFGGPRYPHVREHGNDDNSSELGSEHGNGRISQETEDRYDPQSYEEVGEEGEDRAGTGGRTTHRPLNCPYRKRNKERFNIRDHSKCTNEFKEFGHLKTHIKNFHKREGPSIHQGGQVHDVEDGITEDIDNLLIARKNRHKVSNWEGLWRTLFPHDTIVPSPVYEPCVQATADEFPALARKAMTIEKHTQVRLVSTILTQDLNGGWADAETLLQTASQIVEVMNSQLANRCDQLVREFEHAAIQRSAALTSSHRPRSTKPHRRGNGSSRDMARRGGSAGAPSLPSEQLVSRQRRLHPISNPAGDNTSTLPAYPLHAASHQQQGALNTANPFSPSTDNGYHQVWTPQASETEFVSPTANQYGPQLECVMPAISPWNAFTGQQFSGSIQDNQPSANGILENYQQPLATYSHLNRGSHHPVFSAQYPT